MNILSFGEILWDVYPDEKHIGGAPLNFAAHLAKHGENVAMLSAVGADELGREALAQLDKWGISTACVAVLKEKATGACLVTLDERAVPSYNLLPDVAYDCIPYDEKVTGFDVLYFGTMALRSAYNGDSLRCLLQNGQYREVFVDVNLRPPYYTAETVRFAVENATVIKISDEELPTVAQLLGIEETIPQVFAATLAKQNPQLRCVIITLGADGAMAYDVANDTYYSCAGERVQVASTVGAGDAFSAAFLHQYLRQEELGACLRYAAKVAGFVVSCVGAVPEYDVNDFA